MLTIRSKSECRWDLVSLGEVLLRFDPGDERIHSARSFRVWEGGGEYNVARNLAKCFGMETSIVTALADNQIGRLVEDLVSQGGVDVSRIVWRETDGISRTSRNGMYFMERGFGQRPPTGCSDRANTAISQLRPGEIDWKEIFGRLGVRWFHTGGIFAALSETTRQVAADAMKAARDAGTLVSYDLNYRDSLWSSRGGRDAATKLNRELLDLADVAFGVENFDARLSEYSADAFRRAADAMMSRHTSLKLVATTLRDVHSASRHSIGGVCLTADAVSEGIRFENTDVLDRVGSGDAFASGLIYGSLTERSTTDAANIATASAALSLSSPGDGLAATLAEIETAATRTAEHTVR